MAENTFRPPWYHRNIMSEFMGLVYGVYDAKPEGFVPGGMSLHNQMLPHGPDSDAFEHASNAELKPVKLTNTLAFMFETRFRQRITRYAAELPTRQDDYVDCWKGLKKHFNRKQRKTEMKLASLKGGRDGRLVVVSRDLTRAADASAVAPTLREALDDWAAAEPRLQEIADSLEAGRIAHLPFDPKKCAAPLPRSFGWADGSAYVNHVALVRKSRGAEVPPTFWTDPLMYRGASDEFIGPCDPIRAADTAWGIDLEAEVAVVVDRRAAGRDARAGRRR